MSNTASKEKIEFLEDDFELVGAENVASADKIYASQSYWKDVLSRLKKNKGAIVALASIIIITLLAIFGVGMNEHTYDSQTIAHQNLAPRIPGIENLGIFDGSETMNTSSGEVEVNKYVSKDGKETGLEDVYYWFGTDILGRDIFTEAFLAFIGLGVPAPMASLGSLISEAFKSFTTHPYMILPPVIVLAILMLSFNILADGIRDAFDPKMKER